MGADVVEAAQPPVLAAADEDALVMHRGSDVAARLGEVADMAREMPVAEEDRFTRSGEDVRGGVEMRGQRQRARGIAIERPVLHQCFPSRHGVLLTKGGDCSTLACLLPSGRARVAGLMHLPGGPNAARSALR